MNKFGSKIAFVNLNLSFKKDMLMISSCYFDEKITLKNFEITLIANILTLSLHLRSKKIILHRFSILKLERLMIVFLVNIYRKLTFSGLERFCSYIFLVKFDIYLITLLFRTYVLNIIHVLILNFFIKR